MLGSAFDKECTGGYSDDLYPDEGFIEDVEAYAAKRFISYQMAEQIPQPKTTKTKPGYRMHAYTQTGCGLPA
jgi:hypothetical protein